MRRWAAVCRRRRPRRRRPGTPPSGGARRTRRLVAAEALSPRELDVLKLIAAGDSNKLIARAFDLSPHTVKRHVANILDKLGVQSRGQAAAWYNERRPPRRTPAARRGPWPARRARWLLRAMPRTRSRRNTVDTAAPRRRPPERLMTTTFAATVSPVTPGRRRARARRRMDLYVSIHKALRRFMTDTLTRVGRIDVADRADRDEALGQLERCSASASPPAARERIRPRRDRGAPAGRASKRRRRARRARRVDRRAAGEAAALRDARGVRRRALALRLYRHLALFVAENFQHMHIEETVHNALLWQHYSDAELAELHGRLLASIPGRKELVARWMVPASTPAERATMIGGMKAEVAPEALLGVMAMLRPHLDAAGWAKLAAAAGVGAADAA